MNDLLDNPTEYDPPVDLTTPLDEAEDYIAADVVAGAAEGWEVIVSTLRCPGPECTSKPFLDRFFFPDGESKLECSDCDYMIFNNEQRYIWDWEGQQ